MALVVFEGCSSFESGTPVAVTLYRALRIMYIMLNQVLCEMGNPGKQTRFLGSLATGFLEWKREVRCVTQFMDFYLKDLSATRQKVASEKLKSLVFKASEA